MRRAILVLAVLGVVGCGGDNDPPLCEREECRFVVEVPGGLQPGEELPVVCQTVIEPCSDATGEAAR